MPKTKKNRSTDAVAFGVQRLYDRSAPMLILEAILFAVLGVWMLVRPVGILTGLTFVLGCVLILFGLYRTVAGFVASRGYGGGWLDVLFGLLNIVVGVLFCVYPLGSVISLVYVFVVLFMVQALHTLIFAIQMTRARFGHYVFNLIMAVVMVALAVTLIFWPMAGAVAMVIYLAVMLLMYAFANLFMYVELRRLKRTVVD